jgi:hypothetical protein
LALVESVTVSDIEAEATRHMIYSHFSALQSPEYEEKYSVSCPAMLAEVCKVRGMIALPRLLHIFDILPSQV